MDAQLFDILNDDFGVGEVSAQQEDASPSALPVPQFVSGLSCAEQDWADSLPALCDPRPAGPNPWDPRLVLDLALGIDSTEAILERYALDEATYEHLCQVPTFRRQLAMTMREVREKGLGFAEKCKVQAESYLVEVDEMIHDPAVPASTRLDAIKWVTTQGRLDPKQDKTAGDVSGTTVNLQINFTR